MQINYGPGFAWLFQNMEIKINESSILISM